MKKSDCYHILQAMVPIGRIMQRSCLIDDPNGRLMGRYENLINFIEAVHQLRMKLEGSFDSRLTMKFSRKGDFKQNIFHDIGAEWTLEDKRFPPYSTS